MNDAVREFVVRRLGPDPGLVIEVGSRDVNGAIPRSKRHWGIDMAAGPGVDLRADAERLPFLSRCADVVVSTELLEHVRDWHAVLAEMRRVLKPDGRLLLTTRSPGFEYHGFPHDYWRFTPDDMRAIFPSAEVEQDPSIPGVFVAATGAFPTARRRVYSIITHTRTSALRPWHHAIFALWRIRYAIGRVRRELSV
jgi:SAM-dependent methyltransferase